MKIAITGSTGFIGSHLFDALNKNPKIELTVFDRYKYDLKNVESLKEFVENQDIIVHLGALNRASDLDMKDINYFGTKNLLEAIDKYCKKPVKLIFASSFQVYSFLKTKTKVNERVQPKPESVYGKSKLDAEKAIFNFTRSNKSVKAVILRISNVFGPGCRPNYNSVISTFVHSALKNKQIQVIGKGMIGRDFVYVGDVVGAILRSIDYSPKPFDVFNICSGEFTTLKSALTLIQRLSRKKLKINYSKQKTKKTFLLGDNSKARALLGWRPSTSLARGLKFTIDFMKKAIMNHIMVKKLDVKTDERGWLAEVLRVEDLKRSKNFGQFFVTTANPGIVKGNHFHKRKYEWFCVIKGEAELKISNNYTQEMQVIKMGDSNMVTVRIAPNYTHAIKNVGKSMLYLLAYTDEQFNPEDPDTYPNIIVK